MPHFFEPIFDAKYVNLEGGLKSADKIVKFCTHGVILNH